MTQTPFNTPRRFDEADDVAPDMMRGPDGRIVLPKRTGGGYDTSGIFTNIMQNEDRLASDWRLMGGNPKSFSGSVQANHDLENFLVDRKADRVAANSHLLDRKEFRQIGGPQVYESTTRSKPTKLPPKGKSQCKGGLMNYNPSSRPQSASSRQKAKLLHKLGLPFSQSTSEENPYRRQEILNASTFYPAPTDFATIPSTNKSSVLVPAHTLSTAPFRHHQDISEIGSSGMRSSPVRTTRHEHLRSLNTSFATETPSHVMHSLNSSRPTNARDMTDIRPLASLQGRTPSYAGGRGSSNCSVANISNTTDYGYTATNSSILRAMQNNSNIIDRSNQQEGISLSCCRQLTGGTSVPPPGTKVDGLFVTFCQKNKEMQLNELEAARRALMQEKQDMENNASFVEQKLAAIERENLQMRVDVAELKSQVANEKVRQEQEAEASSMKDIYEEKYKEAQKQRIIALEGQLREKDLKVRSLEGNLNVVETQLRGPFKKTKLGQKSKVTAEGRNKILEQQSYEAYDLAQSPKGHTGVKSLRWFENASMPSVSHRARRQY